MSHYTTQVLDPSTIPQIALESMNVTHREEVELINHLGILLKKGLAGNVDATAITQKLDEWVEHTRGHFDRENQLMREYGFPAFPVHSGEHAKVLSRIEQLQQQWLDNNRLQPLADFIFDAWPQWFDMHVNSMDMVTAQFVRQQSE